MQINIHKIRSYLIFSLSITFLLSQPLFAKDNLKITCTTGMIADIAKMIASDRDQVIQIIGSGVDPHLYKLTRSDISILNDSDIIFYNGLLLEGKMTDALIRFAASGKPVVAVTEKIEETYLLEPEDFSGHHDPHVWMDPKAWSKTIDVISNSLIALAPENKNLYLKNSEIIRKKLSELDDYSERILSLIPKESRILLTAHDAFNYFGKRYGFEVLGIQGISTESEAGVKDIENLVNIIVSKNIKAVFIESTVSDRNIRALIEGAAAKGHNVTLGASLFSDAMGKAGTYEGTYVGMIDHNVTGITRALLSCTQRKTDNCPDAKGMNGLLE